MQQSAAEKDRGRAGTSNQLHLKKLTLMQKCPFKSETNKEMTETKFKVSIYSIKGQTTYLH